MLMLVGNPEKKRLLVDAEDGKGTVSMTFRMPVDIQDKLEAMKARGYGASGAFFLMARAYMEAEAELGKAWWEVEQLAAEQRVGVGLDMCYPAVAPSPSFCFFQGRRKCQLAQPNLLCGLEVVPPPRSPRRTRPLG